MSCDGCRLDRFMGALCSLMNVERYVTCKENKYIRRVTCDSCFHDAKLNGWIYSGL